MTWKTQEGNFITTDKTNVDLFLTEYSEQI